MPESPDNDRPRLTAPFTAEQVQRLNEWQTQVGDTAAIHPFTCANRGEVPHGSEGGDRGVLVATESGWVCPYCDYTQAWAHGFMAQVATDGPSDIDSTMGTLKRVALHLAAYEPLALRGFRGAHVMVDCLLHRQRELLVRLTKT